MRSNLDRQNKGERKRKLVRVRVLGKELNYTRRRPSTPKRNRKTEKKRKWHKQPFCITSNLHCVNLLFSPLHPGPWGCVLWHLAVAPIVQLRRLAEMGKSGTWLPLKGDDTAGVNSEYGVSPWRSEMVPACACLFQRMIPGISSVSRWQGKNRTPMTNDTRGGP
jgi:hypothetical protein